jgi:hypothetical protein
MPCHGRERDAEEARQGAEDDEGADHEPCLVSRERHP